MIAEERRIRITEMLAEQRTVTASELCERLRVTAATIRRDLAKLERSGVLTRSHGGAVSETSSTSFQVPLESQLRRNRIEKQAIARVAEPFVLDGDTVFLEGSTTVLELARLLVSRNRLLVVTNSPGIVLTLQRSPGVKVICTGGELQKDIAYLSGHWAQYALSEIRVDKAILGVSAIDPAYGISTASYAEAQIKKMVMQAAKVCMGLADHSKFGNQLFARVGQVSVLNRVVTDWGTPTSCIDAMRELGVEVLVAPEPGSDGSKKPSAQTGAASKGRTAASLPQ